jgi:hypothetical protein
MKDLLTRMHGAASTLSGNLTLNQIFNYLERVARPGSTWFALRPTTLTDKSFPITANALSFARHGDLHLRDDRSKETCAAFRVEAEHEGRAADETSGDWRADPARNYGWIWLCEQRPSAEGQRSKWRTWVRQWQLRVSLSQDRCGETWSAGIFAGKFDRNLEMQG